VGGAFPANVVGGPGIADHRSNDPIRRTSGTGGAVREIRRILCPVDLSDVSRHAIRHAVLLARWYDAQI
jgi:hypothetical protein